MKRILSLLTLLILAIACETENLPSSSFGDGLYVGSFFRGTPTSLPNPISVTIRITGNKFEGVSDQKLPAICHGTFLMKSDSIIQFANECVFTADFDWTYILQGDFKIRYEEPFLYLTKQYSDGQTYDVYKLEKVMFTIQK